MVVWNRKGKDEGNPKVLVSYESSGVEQKRQKSGSACSARPRVSTRLLRAILVAAIVLVTVSTVWMCDSHLSSMEPTGAETMGFFVNQNIDKTPSNERLRLRYDWSNLSPSLELTKAILKHQNNCSVPMSTFTYRNRFGLGSDLHVYSQALGYGIHTNKRIRTVGNWTWMDQSDCKVSGENDRALLGSPMLCYFVSELNCPGDLEYALSNPDFDGTGGLSKANGNLLTPGSDYGPASSSILPPRTKEGTRLLQTAVVESLFTHVTPRVVEEAERQLNLVFGDKVPKDLITVHIRWGDKVAWHERKNKRMVGPEMEKVEISDYVDAIHKILDQRERTNTSSTKSTEQPANIYLATEDPEAVKEFRKALPEQWTLFVDQFLTETSDHRIDEYNGSPRMAKELNGKAGLLALGSLLVAMEANDFVLTTKSNWSQLMDELRRSILDPRCGNCTSLIDLRKY